MVKSESNREPNSKPFKPKFKIRVGREENPKAFFVKINCECVNL